MIASRPALPPKGQKRKNVSLLVKLRSALRLAGLDPDEPIEWDHDPPLAQRPWIEEIQDYDPPENDDKYLIPRQKKLHREKTAKIDAPAIAKTRRLAKAQQAHAEVLDRIASGRPKNPESARKYRWPKRKFRNKPASPLTEDFEK